MGRVEIWATGRTVTLHVYCIPLDGEGPPEIDDNILHLLKFGCFHLSLEFWNALEMCRVGRAAGRTLTLYGDILGCLSSLHMWWQEPAWSGLATSCQSARMLAARETTEIEIFSWPFSWSWVLLLSWWCWASWLSQLSSAPAGDCGQSQLAPHLLLHQQHLHQH